MGKRKLIGARTLHIAAALTARKDELGWAYDKIAEESGVTKPTVVYALKGEQSITLESYIELCAVLGIDAGRLLNETIELTSSAPHTQELADRHARSTSPSGGNSI